MAFSDCLAIGAGKKLETDNDIKSRWSYHSWYPMWSAVGISWVVPLKISQLCCVPAGTLQLEFHASTVGQLQMPVCSMSRDFTDAPCLFVFCSPTRTVTPCTGQISKTESTDWELYRKSIHFPLWRHHVLSCLAAPGVQEFTNPNRSWTAGCVTHGETSGIIFFFLISNMLTTTRFRENGASLMTR